MFTHRRGSVPYGSYTQDGASWETTSDSGRRILSFCGSFTVTMRETQVVDDIVVGSDMDREKRSPLNN